ncbi:MAG: hypothetical protein J7K87_02930 [Candidatus Aenigmarchaeota archaeon]|nr:hypothetical protein [Candidatus Aenigmarchaeota archaeon]
MNLDPLTLGDVLTSVILILAAVINWKIFMMHYRGNIKPRGRYYFVIGLLLFAFLNQGVEIFYGLSGFGIEIVVVNQLVYVFYVLLKSIGPIVVFYASMVMYKEAKRYLEV